MIFDPTTCCACAAVPGTAGRSAAYPFRRGPLGRGTFQRAVRAGMPRQPERGGLLRRSFAGLWHLHAAARYPLPSAVRAADRLAVQQFLAGLPRPRFAEGASCPSAAELLARVCGAGNADDAASAAAPYTLLCALAHGDEESRRLSPLVARAVEAIRDNYMALYGVEELSAQLGVSKCHLVRVFSSEMGMPPGRFLTSVRIEAAKLLLAEREYSLEMIAGLCGFSGANYLCRVFKRETGLSPAAWRETAAHKAVVQKLPARNNEIYV